MAVERPDIEVGDTVIAFASNMTAFGDVEAVRYHVSEKYWEIKVNGRWYCEWRLTKPHTPRLQAELDAYHRFMTGE